MFSDGGWFTDVKVQVRQNFESIDVKNLSVTPDYPKDQTAGKHQTYTFTFDDTWGDGVKIIGTPGGSKTFTSIGELEVYYAKETPQGVSAADMKALVERFEEKGEFANRDAARSLIIHLTAVDHFERREAAEKVVKHMKRFKVLLDHQQDGELISERAFQALHSHVDALMKKWEQSLR